MGGTPEFRVHPLLLIYPATAAGSRTLVAETSASAAPLILREPLVWFAISLLPPRFAREEALRIWERPPELSGICDDLWRTLTDEDLIVECDPRGVLFEEVDGWAEHGWREAAIYHEATRDFPFVRMDQPDGAEYDEALMKQFADAEPPPPVALQLRGEARIPLTKLGPGEAAEPVLDALGERDRRGTPGLALLLDLCSGERERRHLGPVGDALFKAVPSGGARHPTEAFLALFEGAPEEPGLYHYDVIDHALVRVRVGDERRDWHDATFDLLDGLRPPPFAIVVLATMWERAMWRYRDSRSWRAPVMDIGHVVGAYRTVLTRLGLAHATTQRFDDAALSRLLDVDRLLLTPMSIVAFG